MDKEELLLYEAFGNFAVESLFWSLSYLNNASFETPLREEVKNKLLSLSKSCKTIIMSIYPMENGKRLVAATEEHNRLFIAYVDSLCSGSAETEELLQRWKDNGLEMARLLNDLNTYWKKAEWSAMIGHESDLLEMIAANMKAENYASFVNTAPICRRLAIDMSKYMSKGVIVQQQKKF